MVFVHPQFLWALLAVSIPIIIHLFNFRKYKKVYFTNVKMLKEVELESQSKNRLKELLLLLMRILAITCLVLAFAQPAIVNNDQNIAKRTNHVSIYIDNSFSMDGVNKQGTLLENAKKIGKQIAQSYDRNTNFHIVTNDFEGKHQRLYDKDAILKEINEIKTTAIYRKYSDVLNRQKSFFEDLQMEAKLYCISDLQKNSFDFNTVKTDSSLSIQFVPVIANTVDNLYIDSCWFDAPVQLYGLSQKLTVRINNNSDKDIEAGTLTLKINGKQISISSFKVSNNSSTTVDIQFSLKEKGWQKGVLSITDYPITYDDELSFTFNSSTNINVVCINGEIKSDKKAFDVLFTKDSLFTYLGMNEGAVDYSKFNISDVIILNGLEQISSGLLSELQKFCSKGGAIVIIPGIETNIQNYNALLSKFNLPQFATLDTTKTKLKTPSLENPFFEGVFEKISKQLNVPEFKKHIKLQENTRNKGRAIYQYNNESSFLSLHEFSKAKIFLFTSPLSEEANNFTKHALFVPTFIRIGMESIQKNSLFHSIGSDLAIDLKAPVFVDDAPIKMRAEDNTFEFIPELQKSNTGIKLFINNHIIMPGFYHVKLKDDLLSILGFNHNRNESNLQFHNIDYLESVINNNNWKNCKVFDTTDNNNLDIELKEGGQGLRLWKLFIGLTLLFLLLEILILLLFKKL
ncbi:MAG: BatA domain-containing protein [Bacteroidia bacterium]